jgi:hypothetical protein
VQLIAGVVVLGNRLQNLTTVKNDQEQENRDGKKLRPKTRIILQPALKGLKQRHAPDYGREDNHHELAEHKLSQCHANKIAHSALGRLERANLLDQAVAFVDSTGRRPTLGNYHLRNYGVLVGRRCR